MIGAGSVVTRDIPDRALVLGNPAKVVAWLNEDGTKMKKSDKNHFVDNRNNKWLLINNKLIKADE